MIIQYEEEVYYRSYDNEEEEEEYDMKNDSLIDQVEIQRSQ